MKLTLLILLLYLSAENCAAQLTIDKHVLDFGDIYPGAASPAPQFITLTNSSTTDDLFEFNISDKLIRPTIVICYSEQNHCESPWVLGYPMHLNTTLPPGASLSISVGLQSETIKGPPWFIADTLTIGYSRRGPSGWAMEEQTVALSATAKPAINWTGTEVNVGTMDQGQQATATFYYRNTSASKITWQATTDTNVTVNYNKTVMPYATDSLKVTINTDKLDDSFREYISLNTDDNDFGYYYLFCTGKTVNIKNYAIAEFDSIKMYKEIRKGHSEDGIFVFRFKNAGTIPLVVYNCRASFGVVTCPVEPILPGEYAYVRAYYDVNRPGQFTKALTFSSNDRYHPNKTLLFSGIVK